jgi:DNA-binding winged helix-turn-helix (wHTH) protein
MDSASNSAVRFGPFELDFRAGHLRKGKTRLHLRPQPFKLLSLLVSRAGQLVTREEIQHQLWDEDTFVDFEQGLNVCIRQIRTALNDTPAASRFVETIPRRGYRFIAPSPRVARSTQVNSLAVLPFENGSGDPDLEYLCHGIAESLINTLSAVQQLRVIPRQIAFRFGSSTDLAKIARELNVQAIVSGELFRLARASTLKRNSSIWKPIPNSGAASAAESSPTFSNCRRRSLARFASICACG